MNRISQLTLPGGLQIDLLFKNGKLGYTFEKDGQNYGTAIKVASRKTEDVAVACLLLLTNALETYRELQK